MFALWLLFGRLGKRGDDISRWIDKMEREQPIETMETKARNQNCAWLAVWGFGLEWGARGEQGPTVIGRLAYSLAAVGAMDALGAMALPISQPPLRQYVGLLLFFCRSFAKVHSVDQSPLIHSLHLAAPAYEGDRTGGVAGAGWTVYLTNDGYLRSSSTL